MDYILSRQLLYIFYNEGQPKFFKSGMSDIGYKRLINGEYITGFGEESTFIIFSLKKNFKDLKKLETEFRNELLKEYPRPQMYGKKDIGTEIHVFKNNWLEDQKDIYKKCVNFFNEKGISFYKKESKKIKTRSEIRKILNDVKDNFDYIITDYYITNHNDIEIFGNEDKKKCNKCNKKFKKGFEITLSNNEKYLVGPTCFYNILEYNINYNYAQKYEIGLSKLSFEITNKIDKFDKDYENYNYETTFENIKINEIIKHMMEYNTANNYLSFIKEKINFEDCTFKFIKNSIVMILCQCIKNHKKYFIEFDKFFEYFCKYFDKTNDNIIRGIIIGLDNYFEIMEEEENNKEYEIIVFIYKEYDSLHIIQEFKQIFNNNDIKLNIDVRSYIDTFGHKPTKKQEIYLQSSPRVVLGYPGTGKTSFIQLPIIQYYKERDTKFLFITPTYMSKNVITENLIENKVFEDEESYVTKVVDWINDHTIEYLIRKFKNKNILLIVDEISMLNIVHWKKIINLINRLSIKNFIFTGDFEQIKPVSYSDETQKIQEYFFGNAYTFYDIKDIQRQQNADTDYNLEYVLSNNNIDIQELKKIDDQNKIQNIKYIEKNDYNDCIQEYLDKTKYDKNKKIQTQGLSYTNKDIFELNKKIFEKKQSIFNDAHINNIFINKQYNLDKVNLNIQDTHKINLMSLQNIFLKENKNINELDYYEFNFNNKQILYINKEIENNIKNNIKNVKNNVIFIGNNNDILFVKNQTFQIDNKIYNEQDIYKKKDIQFLKIIINGEKYFYVPLLWFNKIFEKQLGFFITIHKSQGSQFMNTIIYLNDNEIDKNLFLVAFTRRKQKYSLYINQEIKIKPSMIIDTEELIIFENENKIENNKTKKINSYLKKLINDIEQKENWTDIQKYFSQIKYDNLNKNEFNIFLEKLSYKNENIKYIKNILNKNYMTKKSPNNIYFKKNLKSCSELSNYEYKNIHITKVKNFKNKGKFYYKNENGKYKMFDELVIKNEELIKAICESLENNKPIKIKNDKKYNEDINILLNIFDINQEKTLCCDNVIDKADFELSILDDKIIVK